MNKQEVVDQINHIFDTASEQKETKIRWGDAEITVSLIRDGDRKTIAYNNSSDTKIVMSFTVENDDLRGMMASMYTEDAPTELNDERTIDLFFKHQNAAGRTLLQLVEDQLNLQVTQTYNTQTELGL